MLSLVLVLRIRDSESLLEPELTKHLLRDQAGRFGYRVTITSRLCDLQRCLHKALRDPLSGKARINGQHEQVKAFTCLRCSMLTILIVEFTQHAEDRQEVLADE